MKRYLILLVCLLTVNLPAIAQKQRRSPPKQENTQTEEDAIKKKATEDAANKAKIQEEYKAHKEHQDEIQTKATQKRMKQSYKKAKKLDKRGTTEPFYRRWFHRKKF